MEAGQCCQGAGICCFFSDSLSRGEPTDVISYLLAPLSQVWESVPFLAAYQSSAIKEEALIPNYPHELIRTWEGNCSRGLACVRNSCWLNLHSAPDGSLPPSPPAPQPVCLSILGHVLSLVSPCVRSETLGEIFPRFLLFLPTQCQYFTPLGNFCSFLLDFSHP